MLDVIMISVRTSKQSIKFYMCIICKSTTIRGTNALSRKSYYYVLPRLFNLMLSRSFIYLPFIVYVYRFKSFIPLLTMHSNSLTASVDMSVDCGIPVV